jgi:hypothetical protein
VTLKNVYFVEVTTEIRLSEFIRTGRHPDMLKIRVIGFSFENRIHWQFEVLEKFLQAAVVGYIFIYVTIKELIYISLYVFDIWGKILSHKNIIVTVR